MIDYLSLLTLFRTVQPLGPGRLFELAIGLAQAIGRARDTVPLKAFWFEAERLLPSDLAKAGAALHDWRDGFAGLADMMRSHDAERRGRWGINKELGPIARLAASDSVSPEVKRALQDAIAENMRSTSYEPYALTRSGRHNYRDDLVSIKKALEILRSADDKLRRLVDAGVLQVVAISGEGGERKFRREEIESIAERSSDAVRVYSAARGIGLSVGALVELTEAGLLKMLDPTSLGFPPDLRLMSRSSIDALVEAVAGKITPLPEGPTVSLGGIVAELAFRRKVWGAVVTGILDGALNVHVRGGDTLRIWDLRVDEREVVALVRARAPYPDEGGEYLTYPEAADVLGVCVQNVGPLVDSKLLPSLGCHRGLRLSDLWKFRGEYMFSPEAAELIGCHSTKLRARLATHQVEPVACLRGKFRILWLRSAVVAAAEKERLGVDDGAG